MERLFLSFSVEKLRQLQGRIDDCLARLSFDEVWWRASEENNSAGNLVLHLSGNVRQWILATIGGRADERNRDAEFNARANVEVAELRRMLAETVAEAGDVIENLSAARLKDQVLVQGYNKSVLEAVYHVVEHFAMHTGQIIYITKMLRKEDLGYYGHLAQAAAHTERTP